MRKIKGQVEWTNQQSAVHHARFGRRSLVGAKGDRKKSTNDIRCQNKGRFVEREKETESPGESGNGKEIRDTQMKHGQRVRCTQDGTRDKHFRIRETAPDVE